MTFYPNKDYIIVLRFEGAVISLIVFTAWFILTLFFPIISFPVFILFLLFSIIAIFIYPGLYFKSLKYKITETKIAVSSKVFFKTVKTICRNEVYSVTKTTNPILRTAELYTLHFNSSGGRISFRGVSLK